MFTTTKVKSAYMHKLAILYRTAKLLPVWDTKYVVYSNYLLNADDVKVILNEGMPHHKNPFDKGRLIINFKVGVDGHLRLHQWINYACTLLSGQIPLSWISQRQETERAGQTLTSSRRTNAYWWLLWGGITCIPHLWYSRHIQLSILAPCPINGLCMLYSLHSSAYAPQVHFKVYE